jgi:drug/metabolite transporter (DMT)-like permease
MADLASSSVSRGQIMKRDDLANLALLATVIFAWSTSWIALKGQTGVIAAEVSVFWRFLLAAPFVFAYAYFRRARLAFTLAEHLGAALLGVCIFSTNFILFYHGAVYLPSGLLSVVFSLASVINLALAFLFFGEKASPKVLIGGLMGFAGVALMFEPQIEASGGSPTIWTGLAFCAAGTFCFCLGNMVSSRLQKRGVPVIGAASWGMIYGTIWAGILALVRGAEFTVEWTWTYLGGMLYLSTICTVVAFLTYLTLLGRVGAGRAGYATVLFPVFALLISAVFEDYRLTLLAVIGLGLVAAGNYLVLKR